MEEISLVALDDIALLGVLTARQLQTDCPDVPMAAVRLSRVVSDQPGHSKILASITLDAMTTLVVRTLDWQSHRPKDEVLKQKAADIVEIHQLDLECPRRHVLPASRCHRRREAARRSRHRAGRKVPAGVHTVRRCRGGKHAMSTGPHRPPRAGRLLRTRAAHDVHMASARTGRIVRQPGAIAAPRRTRRSSIGVNRRWVGGAARRNRDAIR
ncbi:hypothetical protein [Sphingomonas sp. 22R3R2A-7]|uniref:hypothetical protein n=1 Tax=Sphingomonas sp. 22R3R2A-7 TaxID=3050230 RepID=UPI002FE0DE9E